MAALIIVGSAMSVFLGAVLGATILKSLAFGLALGVFTGWLLIAALVVIAMGLPDRRDGLMSRR